jgi:hypothetical protein
VLEQLRRLDRGQDRGPATTPREALPGLQGVPEPAEPAQEVGAIDGDPLRRPRPVDRRGRQGRRRFPERSWTAAEVGCPARRPPRLVAGGLPVLAAAARRRDHGERRLDLAIGGRVEAVQGLMKASFARECPGQPGQVPGRRAGPAGGVGELALEVGQQPGQRSDVLVVVANDVDERLDRAAAQEGQVVAGDLPAFHVADPVEPEELRLGRPQPGVAETMAEQPTDDRQQVEVAPVRRRGAAGEAVARHQQRPIEGATVVGDQPGTGGDGRLEGGQHGPFLAVVRQQQLDLSEGIGLPPAQPDQERGGPGRGRQTGRLGVEADQRHVRRWLAG